MKKLNGLLLVFLLSIMMVLSACSTDESSVEKEKATDTTEQTETATDEKESFGVTITDATGNEITLEEKPERIVSLIPSNTEILFELGLGDAVVGVSDYDNYPEEATTKEKIGGMEFNVEKVISLTPDLVLGHASSMFGAEEAFQQLRDAGITVVIVNDSLNLDDVYKAIDMIGQVTGEVEKSKTVIEEMKANIEKVKEKVASITEVKNVFIEVSPEPEIYSPGNNTFMHELIKVINAKNVIEDQEGWVKIDPEAIIERNPDVIVTTYGYYVENPVEQVMNRTAWKDVNAIKNNQVIDVDSDQITRPGPRLDEGVEELAKAIYPDVFK